MDGRRIIGPRAPSIPNGRVFTPVTPRCVETAVMQSPPAPATPWWTLQRSDDRVLATAIHDGHALRPDIAGAMALDEVGRLREEDPWTGQAAAAAPTHVIAGRSRFEVDLNRGEDAAFYRTPDQCWGLDVWRSPPSPSLVEGSLRLYRAFYAMMAQLLDDIREAHGAYVLIDVHSYNHRRGGPEAPPTPQAEAPDINIGTFSMPRARWAPVLDPLIEAMRDFDFRGRRLDVRENVAFQGRGALTRFVHARHPGHGCAIALEFKKFFMDEWTGQPDTAELAAMRGFIGHVVDTARALLDRHG